MQKYHSGRVFTPSSELSGLQLEHYKGARNALFVMEKALKASGEKEIEKKLAENMEFAKTKYELFKEGMDEIKEKLKEGMDEVKKKVKGTMPSSKLLKELDEFTETKFNEIIDMALADHKIEYGISESSLTWR